MSARATKPALATSFVGEKVVGFILRRGYLGFEAWTADEKSLGLFPSEDDAHSALVAEAQRTA